MHLNDHVRRFIIVGAVCSAVAAQMVLMPPRATAVDFEIPPGFTQAQFDAMAEDAGLAVSYAAAAPAEPLGFPHFDVGVEATATKINPNDAHWSAVFNGDAPSYLLVPKLRARMGLPFGIDIGAIYSTIPYVKAGLLGGEVKWAAYKGSVVMPAIALRGTYTTTLNVDELKMETYSADISISKGFLVFTPYAGVGQVWVKAEEKSALVTLSPERFSKTRGFVGLQIGIPLIRFVLEGAFSTVQSYTARLSVGF
jgi:hypothetical protein